MSVTEKFELWATVQHWATNPEELWEIILVCLPCPMPSLNSNQVTYTA